MSNEWTEAGDIRRIRQAHYLAGYLRHFDAETILIEYDYVDRDYLDDYSCFYVSNFRSYAKLTKRLHFFSWAFDENSVTAILAGSAPQDFAEMQKSYLGFCVARPLPAAIIGRTILKTYERQSPQGERFFPTCRDYHPNLFGIELPLQSLAYQQQDKAVAACATVALWSTFHKTQRLFDSPRPSPASITRSANLVGGNSRAMPTQSLTVEQIAQAIRFNALEPESAFMRDSMPLASLIYAYVAFGIPVVLLVYIPEIGGHAITVTGYAIDETQRSTPEPVQAISYRGRKIARFFVHDDNIGPFAHLQMVPKPDAFLDPIHEDYCKAAPFAFDMEWKNEDGERESLVCAPYVVTIPIDAQIRLTFSQLNYWLESVAAVFEQYGSKLAVDTKEMQWDVRLSTSNDFKSEIRSALPDDETFEALLTPYPRFIWRITVTMAQRNLFDLTADATEMPEVQPFLNLIYYDKRLGEKLMRYFSLKVVAEMWANAIGTDLTQFLAIGHRPRNLIS